MSKVKESIRSFVAYLGEVGVEFKKITWPDRQELVDSTVVVLVFIVILAVVVLCCDKTILFFLQLIHA
ncbi:MAG TPA: preprotein translocase subunit SecE [Kiritimatiellia bacterium]|jgi:preprotein translocase subunit SecE|nr:preprotein translocase subunit SecE [Kiritimatiellia bacterium]HOR97209.1 preprotein translocase subunit SecE [Kiritimatiellia bacterium]HPW75191.1 preprotein translocase subunit SecE [Kiritimatiellia bacterium]